MTDFSVFLQCVTVIVVTAMLVRLVKYLFVSEMSQKLHDLEAENDNLRSRIDGDGG